MNQNTDDAATKLRTFRFPKTLPETAASATDSDSGLLHSLPPPPSRRPSNLNLASDLFKFTPRAASESPSHLDNREREEALSISSDESPIHQQAQSRKGLILETEVTDGLRSSSSPISDLTVSNSRVEHFYPLGVRPRFPEFIRRSVTDWTPHRVEEAQVNPSANSKQQSHSGLPNFNIYGQSDSSSRRTGERSSANTDSTDASSSTQTEPHQEPGGLSPRPRLPLPAVLRKRTMEFRKRDATQDRGTK